MNDLHLEFCLIRDLFLSDILDMPLVKQAILANQVTSVADFHQFHEAKLGVQFSSLVNEWRHDIEERKRQVEEVEAKEAAKAEFKRDEVPDLGDEASANGGLQQIRYSCLELLTKFTQGLSTGQDNARPKKLHKLAKKLQNLLDGIAKKNEMSSKAPPALKNLIVANCLNFILTHEIVQITDAK